MIQSDTCILFIIIYYLFYLYILFYFVETPILKKKLILFTIRECSKVEGNKISIQSIVILYSNKIRRYNGRESFIYDRREIKHIWIAKHI